MKKIHYITLLIGLLFSEALLIAKVNGQQRQVFSQYMFNGLSINPAYAGNQKMFSGTLLYRKQWLKLDGSPNTQTLSMHNGAKKKKIGLGLIITRDEIGVHRNLGLYACLAYKIKFKKGTFAWGIQGGFDYLSSNYHLLKVDPTYDPLLPARTSVYQPNVGGGMFYSTKKAYFGFSIPYMINNKILSKKSIDVHSNGTQERYYFITAGKVFPLTKHVMIKPSTLIQIQEEAPINMDFNANLIFYDALSIGTSYRTGRSMVFLAEIIVTENLRFGYSYDYTFSALHSYNKGSHEIMLNYRIDLNPEKCHTYF